MEGYESFKPLIRIVKDWPIKGVNFKDITMLLNSDGAFTSLINKMCKEILVDKVDYIVGIEARGFIFGAAMAAQLGIGFVPIRKIGKLPSTTLSVSYELEYGGTTLEIHKDAFRLAKDKKVLIVDDVLATGGTAGAAISLVEGADGVVAGLLFLMDVPELKGKEVLADYKTMILMED